MREAFKVMLGIFMAMFFIGALVFGGCVMVGGGCVWLTKEAVQGVNEMSLDHAEAQVATFDNETEEERHARWENSNEWARKNGFEESTYDDWLVLERRRVEEARAKLRRSGRGE